jgi:hypothetical protein
MPYIGRDTDKISNVEVLDNITFDGSSSYTLQKGGSNFTPSSANTLLLSIDGVVQAGNFTVSGSTIDFGTAVAGTSTCDFVLHYGVGLITTPSDGTVTTAKLADSSITTAKINDNAITLDKMASGTDGNIISYDASGNPVAVATGSAGQILTSAGAGSPPTFATPASAGKILGVAADWSSIGESTTSSSFVDIPSNKGRISYTTVGANSNFIVTNMVNWKQTGNHPNYLYFGNVRYLIELQSDLSVLATGNSRGYMININEGTLITDNGSTTENDFLDPGTLAAGTAIYFQPQFNTQSTLTVAGIQTVIWEIAA